MDDRLQEIARRAKGFMPEDEALALYKAGLSGARSGPLLEIGSYCGKSTVYLGAAAQEGGQKLFTIDHHRGSEEHQPGEEYHDKDVFDSAQGRVDTLPGLLATIRSARLSNVVAPLIGDSGVIAESWQLPLGLVFIDGGHSEERAQGDYVGWAPHVRPGGFLVIHDVFEDPEEGGPAPCNVFLRATTGGAFAERSRTGSLRVLERIGDGI